MEDLAVFTAINHSGSFGKNFVKFKNNKYVIYRLRVGPYGEFFTIRTSQPANNIYVHGRNRPVANLPVVDFRSLPLLGNFE